MDKMNTPGRVAVAPKSARYSVTDPEAVEQLKALGIDAEFDALSIGTSAGSVAIVPLDESSEENATRLAACWNAFDGIPLHTIKAIQDVGGLPIMVARVDDLKRVNTQSRDALGECLRLLKAIEEGADPKDDPESLAALKGSITQAIGDSYHDDQQQARLSDRRRKAMPDICKACNGEGGSASWVSCHPCAGSGWMIPF